MFALLTYHRNVSLSLIMGAMANAQFINSVWVVYLASQKQVGAELFILIEGVFALAMVLMEIPSGYLSDRFNRVYVLRAAEVLFAASLAVLLLGDGLVSVVISQLLLGVGFSFNSGTQDALVYESLEEAGKADMYSRYLGWGALVNNVTLSIATLAGGWLYLEKPDLPVLCWLAAAGVSVVCAMGLRQVARPVIGPKQGRPGMLHDLYEMLAAVFVRARDLRAYLLIGAVFAGTLNVFYWIQQPYYQQAGVTIAWFGPLLFAEGILNGCGGWMAGHWPLQRYFGEQAIARVVLAIVVTMVGVTALLAILPVGMAGIALFIALGWVWGYGEVTVRERIQHLALPHLRATLLSVASFLRQCWFFGFSAVAALALGYGGVTWVYAAGAVLAALVFTPMLMVLFQLRRE